MSGAPSPLTTADLVKALEQVRGWLDQFARAEDLDDSAADGGVTVAMVYQQEARTVQIPRLARIASALPAYVLAPREALSREAIARELAWQLGDTMGDARGVFLSSEMHTNGERWLKAADAILAMLAAAEGSDHG